MGMTFWRFGIGSRISTPLEWSLPFAPGVLQPCPHPFPDQVALEFRENPNETCHGSPGRAKVGNGKS
jgi:hypothetical protein